MTERHFICSEKQEQLCVVGQNYDFNLNLKMFIFLISLTCLYGSIKCDSIDNANTWLNTFIDPMFSRIDDRNTDLSPTTGAAPKACVNDKMEQGVCVKTSLCMKPEPTVDPTTLFTLRDSEPCVAQQSCCLQKNVRNLLKPLTSNIHDQCGFSNPGANDLREKVPPVSIADFGEFPWMVALIRKDQENNGWEQKYAGGGALIHPSVVITAAHKVEDYEANEIKIRAGEWDTRSETEEYPYQERDVKKIITHENYFKVHAHNNVALLILKSPVDLTDAPHIGVACLSAELPAPGTRCFGMGWGKSSIDGDKYADKLKKLELPLVGAAECERKFKNSKLGSRFSLHRTLTCAGGVQGVDTCEGDGGSPLVCGVPGESSRYAVVGLVTYGLDCGAKLPAAYLNVPELYDWVGGRLTLEGIDKNSFVY